MRHKHKINVQEEHGLLEVCVGRGASLLDSKLAPSLASLKPCWKRENQRSMCQKTLGKILFQQEVNAKSFL